jgi:uncharacterized membrane protein YfcA
VPSLAFIAEPLFLTAAAAALVAAIVRGFSGFGAGLIFMPIGAACLGPKQAAGILFVIDTLLILPFVPAAARIVDWREILPLGISAMLMVPVGAAILVHADPVPLRWVLCLTILASVGLLAMGWRYRGPTRAPLSVLVGSLAGFLSGFAQIPGPPVLIYWLGREIVSRTMRANAIVFFMTTTIISGVAYLVGGIFTEAVLVRAAVLLPIYGVGMFFGSRFFGLAGERTYRGIAYAAILFAAIVSMPIFG